MTKRVAVIKAHIRLATVFGLCSSIVLVSGCAASGSQTGGFWFERFQETPLLRDIYTQRDAYRVEVLLTRLDDAGRIVARERLTGDGAYFYPASTVKLPTALVALETIERLLPGVSGVDTVLRIGTTQTLTRDAVRDVFVLSDNAAFNVLYELAGHDNLNTRLQSLGYASARIQHRLGVVMSPSANRKTPNVQVLAHGAISNVPAQIGAALPKVDARLGRGEVIDGQLVLRPKDFGAKNALSLMDCHDAVYAVMFPANLALNRRFSLSAATTQMVRNFMSATPAEAGIQPDGGYSSDYVKFLFAGAAGKGLPEGITVWNKIGQAYGFVTDCAFVQDEVSGEQFLLAARIYTNANGIFNDDQYEYQTVALPFMRDLGLSVLRYIRSSRR